MNRRESLKLVAAAPFATGFTWTPTELQGGLTPIVTVTVTDNGTGNLVDSETFSITVNDINVAPVLDPIGNQTVDELATLTFTATATDSDLPADTLTFSLDTAAIALGTVSRSVLHGAVVSDPKTWGLAIVLLLSASALACWLPSRRAARVAPGEALRYE